MTVVNGSHAWPLTGGDPTGRRLVTHDVDWTKRIVSFWNTYAGMGLATRRRGPAAKNASGSAARLTPPSSGCLEVSR